MRKLILAATFIVAAAPAHAAQVWLTMDQVRPYELEKPAGQIVVGNPAIADVTVQDKERVLLFGKGLGVTNMYIFDDDGNVVENIVIRVNATTSDMLTMHRGIARTTYNCTSQCEPTLTVGDDNDTFGEVQQQVTSKVQQAQQSVAGQ